MAGRGVQDFGLHAGQGTGGAAGEAVVARLRAIFGSATYKPPLLPAVALKIHQLAQDPDVDVRDLVQLLERDALLAARVLRVAQSAAYCGQSEVSLQGALTRLGLRGLRDLVWETALNMRVFRSKRFAAHMEAVARHSTMTAHMTKLVVPLTAMKPEHGFICGLLHDIGAAAALIVLEEDPRTSAHLADDDVGAVLSSIHQEASRSVAALWGLPVEIQSVLGNHHVGVGSGPIDVLCQIVIVAEQLVSDFAPTGSKDRGMFTDGTSGPVFLRACASMGLEDMTLENLRQQARLLCDRIAPRR